MPYYITDSNPDCAGWAVEKEDGEAIGCHDNKQSAIDQMVAVSLAEGIEPGGERYKKDDNDDDDDDKRVAPDAVDVGDYVSWDSAGGRARGRITRIVRSGTLNVPGTDFTLNADEDNPAALIRVYRPVGDGWEPSGPLVGHRFATLTKIQPLPKPSPEDRSLPDNYRPATSPDVPEGRACGNCIFFNEADVAPDGRARCTKWGEYVAGGWYCNAWEPRENANAERVARIRRTL